MKHKRYRNEFAWVPLHQRKGRFGFPLSNKVDNRKPFFWITLKSKKQQIGSELYLINESAETLEYISSSSAGFSTVEDEMVSYSTKKGGEYCYQNVRPGEAVMVEEYDDYYDLDCLSQVYLVVKSTSLGVMKISTSLNKGAPKETVLLWETKEIGKDIHVSSENAT